VQNTEFTALVARHLDATFARRVLGCMLSFDGQFRVRCVLLSRLCFGLVVVPFRHCSCLLLNAHVCVLRAGLHALF
jgi:hypothetical protein